MNVSMQDVPQIQIRMSGNEHFGARLAAQCMRDVSQTMNIPKIDQRRRLLAIYFRNRTMLDNNRALMNRLVQEMPHCFIKHFRCRVGISTKVQ